MNRNDHYVTQLSLEVGLSVLNEIKEISSFLAPTGAQEVTLSVCVSVCVSVRV